jgi:hypothetical protein
MRTIVTSAALAFVLLSCARPQSAFDVQVLLTVAEPGPRGITRQTEFSKQAQPGAGKQLATWIQSSSPCRAVVVAFDRDGRVAYQGLPSVNTIREHSTNQLPAGAQPQWTWDQPGRLAELDLVLIDGDPPEARDLMNLVRAMQDAPPNDVLRKRQDTELRHWLDGHMRQRSSIADYSIKPTPEVIGGMMRGAQCDWCKSAQTVSVPAGGFSILRIHIERTG